MTEYTVLGKRLPRVDAQDKATGRAMYSGDISLPNMLYGKVLRSPYAHAKIRKLDVSKAKALKGVMAVITAEDVPEQKEKSSPKSPRLAREKVLYAGQPIAAVAAINLDIAVEAVSLIEVDYEELPPVMDAFEAMKPDAVLIFPDVYTNLQVLGQTGKTTAPSNITWQVEIGSGDIEAGFKGAYVVLENIFHTQAVHQGYLEPRSALAAVDPRGKVTIWTDSHGAFGVRDVCADFLNIPISHIKVMPVEVGGSFGAKQFHPLAPIAALLALKTGRPVKIVMTREEDFVATSPAPASIITLKMGVDKEGNITAAAVSVVCDIGAFNRQVGDSLGSTIQELSLYRIPNLSIKVFNVITNKAPTGPYRAPNAADAAFAVESQMDLLARALQMDPIDFRLKNAVAEGDRVITNPPFSRIGFTEALLKMKDYLNRRDKPEGKNRGTGIACGLWPAFGGACSAQVNVTPDGSVTLLIGSLDLTGPRTSLAQIVAEEFGIAFDLVTVVTGDTDAAPYSEVSAGSKITRQMGIAVRRACQDAKDQLARQAAPLLKVEPTDFSFTHGNVQVNGMPEKSVSLSTLVRNSIGRFGSGPITGRGSVGVHPTAPIFVVQMADVEVDKETGKVKILSYAAAQDVGFAINPSLIEGQIQGAVAQGIGRTLMEEYVFQNGIMQNPNLLDYRIPTAADLPFIDTMLIEVGSGIEPFGARAVGEPPMIPTLAAVANAIHSATGVRLKELPMTPEAVLKTIQAE